MAWPDVRTVSISIPRNFADLAVLVKRAQEPDAELAVFALALNR